ncbi:ATP-dependent RNA helicase [Penicillium brevicompactum]|uniref:ATP-dependent rRNA helicase RRP3 n=1 Tax=Penicillium brevicompactum TaxID=5074 RepID=A0A9W9RX84_PENBR|nr:ATP-dependent RNA helicase [Penicillium brevicompactum]
MPITKKRKVAPAPVDEAETNIPSSPEPSPEAPSDQEEAAEDNDAEVGENEASPPKSFKELGLIESLTEACANMGYKQPTPIQSETIPLALQGRDIIGLAETGSGKTAAFTLPLLQFLMEKPQPFFGLILAPTRELAYQISLACESLGSTINVRSVTLVGGMDMVPQSIALGKKPHIIVATPGRLLDHLENTKGFSLRNLKYLVMDEADRLLDMDFGPILDKILKVLPRERRTFLFSATLSSKVESLQRASLSNPARVSISSSKYQTVSTLNQTFLLRPFKHKDIYLVYLLHKYMGQSAIIFMRTVHETQRIAFLLRGLGFGAIPLHGQMSQSARLGALGKFRSKSREILIATDVAARGLDIPSVDIVLNYDLPSDSKTYIHRVGRTARAGKAGTAISFVSQYDVEVWQRIETALGKQLQEHDAPKEDAMVFEASVHESQRDAIQAMKVYDEKKGAKGKGKFSFKGKRGRDAMDQEEG